MIFCWKGMGFLVPLIAIGLGMVIEVICLAVLPAVNVNTSFAIGLLLAGIAVWHLGHKLHLKPARTLVDKTTGQEIVISENHTFWFIKMQYWSYILWVWAVFLLLFPAQRIQ